MKTATGLTIQVKVKPNARISALTVASDGGVWQAQLNASPVDGKANEELIALVAAHFAVPKRAVTIRSGAGARLKLLRIEGA